MSSTGGPLQGKTQYYEFSLVNFNWFTWQDYEHDNWRLVDSLLYLALGGNSVRGYWLPGTAYEVGDRVVDDVDGTLWECGEDHTSGNTTMADDRAANPTWWGAVVAGGGDVVGPVNSVDDNIAVFDGTTGKRIKDSGVNIADIGSGGITWGTPVDNTIAPDTDGLYDIGEIGNRFRIGYFDTVSVDGDIFVTGNVDGRNVSDDGATLDSLSAGAPYAPAVHTHVESDITNLQPYLLSVLQDTTPQLGGSLDTLGKQIEFRTAGGVAVGLTGLTATDDALFFGYSPNVGYDPNDGAIVADAGGLELHGSVVNVPTLATPDNETHQVYVDELGNLFTVAPPPAGWTASDTDTGLYDLGSGAGTPAWTNLTGLAITAQDVAVGERLDIYVRVHAVNSSGNQTGNLAIGFGIDGVDPAGTGQLVPISAGFDGAVSVNLSTTTAAITAGQTINIFARRTGGAGNFALTLDGTISIHEAIATRAAESGGGARHIIADEGNQLADQPILNFVGDGVSVANGVGETIVTITGTGGGGITWGTPVNANIVPDADSTWDLGSSPNRFANAYIDVLTGDRADFDNNNSVAPAVSVSNNTGTARGVEIISTSVGSGEAIWVEDDAGQKMLAIHPEGRMQLAKVNERMIDFATAAGGRASFGVLAGDELAPNPTWRLFSNANEDITIAPGGQDVITVKQTGVVAAAQSTLSVPITVQSASGQTAPMTVWEPDLFAPVEMSDNGALRLQGYDAVNQTGDGIEANLPLGIFLQSRAAHGAVRFGNSNNAAGMYGQVASFRRNGDSTSGTVAITSFAGQTGPALTFTDSDGEQLAKVNVDGDAEFPKATISPPSDSVIPLLLKGAVGQTADLTQWKDSTDVLLASVDPAGNISATNLSGTNTGDAFLENHPFAMTNPTNGTLSGAEMATAGTVTRVSAAFAGTGITGASVMVRKKASYNGAATDLLTVNLTATAAGAVGTLDGTATSLAQFDILEVEVSGVTGTVVATDQVIVNVHVEHVGGT